MMRYGRSIERIVLVALLAILLLVLGGCKGVPQEREQVELTTMQIEEPASAPTQDGWSPHRIMVSLYFLDEEGERLVPVTRQIETDGELQARAALWALLEGPLEGEEVYWPDLGDVHAEAWAEFSGEVATVSLPARARALSPQMLYAVRLAIAGTLTEFSHVSYVNILVDGREEGVDLGATQSAGTLSRVQDMDVGTRYRNLIAQGQDERGSTIRTSLFFPTTDGTHVLPTVRSVAFASTSAVDKLYTLLMEIGRVSPDDLLAQSVPKPMDYIIEMPEIVWAGEGAYRAVELRFSAELDRALLSAGLTRGIYLAMLTDTLLGFVPGVDALTVTIGGEAVIALAAEETPDAMPLSFERGMIRRGDFVRYAASPIVLYAPLADRGRVRAVVRALDQERQRDLRARLLSVMDLCKEAGLWQGLGEEDILGVYVQDDTALVNLSETVRRAIEALTPDGERATVYAMVDTLTEDEDIRCVAFYFDGRQIERLTGALEMRGRFLRNPGWVVE